MSKDKMLGMRIIKVLGGPIFKLYYRPTVIGKENIPTDGSMLVVGNHVHILDQCLAIIATKRPLHYMAKKEYFDGKFAWFFKFAGCIPVNRQIKDEAAKGAALEVLKHDYALGLFPEGTRNGPKQEKIDEVYEIVKEEYPDKEEFTKIIKKQKTSFINYLLELVEKKKIKKKDFISNIDRVNDYLLELIDKKVISKDDYYENILLPFKFGAVSMAQKTDSYLVPYAITGEYKFRSKDLTVRFGKPFKVGDDLEKANTKLRKEIAKLMRESMENSEK